MAYLLFKQGTKQKYLQCKICNMDFFSNSVIQNQKLVGTFSVSVKSICANCGETSSWRFTNATVEERESMDSITNYGNTTSCDECSETSIFFPPPKTINKELFVSYRCKNNHITIRKYILK